MADSQYDPPPADVDDDLAEAPEDATVVVDRIGAEPDEETVLVDATVVVARAGGGHDGLASDDGAAPEDVEATVVVERAAPDDVDEGTVVVDRAALADGVDEGTVVVDRTELADGLDDGPTVVVTDLDPSSESTVVVDRTVADSRSQGASSQSIVDSRAVRGDSVLRVLPRRRGKITAPPPGTEAVGRPAVEAIGPGAVESYLPREIPALPEPSIEVLMGADATRGSALSMPSVLGQSRRFGLVTIAAFAGACVFSLGALSLVLLLVLG